MMQQSASPNGDYCVPNSPPDGISSLTFSPNNQFLVAGSWDNGVRCYEIQSNATAINATPRAQVNLDGPVLCSDFSADGATVFAGGCDGTARSWQLGQPTATVIGKHDAPIKSIHCVTELGVVVTGSWDKTIKCWDTRQPQPVTTIQLPERCYSMDIRHPLMVIGTAERKIMIYDLSSNSWQTPFRVEESPLRHQTRCVAAFPDKEGFAIGSIEGRVAIHHVNPKNASRNFAFKCHRETTDARAGQASVCNIYSVNSIVFHNLGTFATAGSDGVYNFWDKENKQRLMAFKKNSQSISCAAFNPAGSLYAYALSYDWSRGSEGFDPNNQVNQIMLHSVKKEEITQRNKKSGTRK